VPLFVNFVANGDHVEIFVGTACALAFNVMIFRAWPPGYNAGDVFVSVLRHFYIFNSKRNSGTVP
jgi:hypothetical protein